MKVTVGVTGASGSIYAQRLIQVLIPCVEKIFVIFTESAKQVCTYELQDSTETADSFNLRHALKPSFRHDIVSVFQNDNLFASIASGSSVSDAMVVVPCSMGTLARINHGTSSCLLERAADVVLKQNKRLVICPRETPMSTIHLRNMYELSQVGALMAPLMPAFYNHPKSVNDMIDFCIGRILETLELSHTLYPRWQSNS